MRCRRYAPTRIVAVIALLFGGLISLPAQQSDLNVVLTGIRPTGDAVDEAALAQSISDTTELVLRLSGNIQVDRADFIVPTYSFETAEVYYRSTNTDRAVFGTLGTDEQGKRRLEVSIWKSETGEMSSIQRTIEDIFLSFNLAEEIGREVAQSILGRNIAFGTISIGGTDSIDDYGVYVDGILVGRNLTVFDVPVGKHEVIIGIPGALGDRPVRAFDVRVLDSEIVEIAVERATGDTDDESLPSDIPSDSADPAVRIGTLEVTSTPSGADVFLDEQRLGTTPRSFYGVPVGRYELTVAKPMFTDVVRVVDIQEGTKGIHFALKIDRDSPEVTSLLIPTWGPSLAAFTWTLAEFGFFMAQTTLDGDFGRRFPLSERYYLDVLFVDSLFLLGRLGFYASRSTDTGRAISLVGLGVFELGKLINFMSEPMSAAKVFGYVLMFGSATAATLYDIGFSPSAAVETNNKILTRIRSDDWAGSEPEQPARRWIVELDMTGTARVGYAVPLFDNLLSLETLPGIWYRESRNPPTGPLLSLQLKVRPFIWLIDDFSPFLSASATVEYDFTTPMYYAHGGFGYEIPTKFLTFQLETGLRYELDTSDFRVYTSLGMRF